MKTFFIFLFLLISPLCFAYPINMEVMISAEEIEAKICEVTQVLNREYRDKKLTVLMVMKGAVCITADLIRHLEVPFKLEYLKASSYGYNGMKGGPLTINGLENLDIQGRDVLIVDDILETGNTMLSIIDTLQSKYPNSIKTLLLLVKDIPRKVNYRPDYVLFDIPDRFVIGYGLDYKELYRGLPDICAFINNLPPF